MSTECLFRSSYAVHAFALVTLLAAHGASAGSADDFIERAIAFRTIAVLEAGAIDEDLARMPATPVRESADSRKTLHRLVGALLRNSIVKVGHIESASPISLYYDPLVDVGLLATWRRKGERSFTLTSLQAVPGEALDESLGGNFEVQPAWLRRGKMDASPWQLLKRVATSRLDGFAARFPARSHEAVPACDPRGPAAKRRQALAELRIVQATSHWRLLDDGALEAAVLASDQAFADLSDRHWPTEFERVSGPIRSALAEMKPSSRRSLQLAGVFAAGPSKRVAVYSLVQGSPLLVLVSLERTGSSYQVESIHRLVLR